MQGLRLWILAPNQNKALHDYFVQLDKIGMPARLHLIEQATNSVLQMNVGPNTPPSKIGPQWPKRWLKRQDNLYKVKRKPITTLQKNAEDPELLMGYFEKYKKLIEEFEFDPEYQ